MNEQIIIAPEIQHSILIKVEPGRTELEIAMICLFKMITNSN